MTASPSSSFFENLEHRVHRPLYILSNYQSTCEPMFFALSQFSGQRNRRIPTSKLKDLLATYSRSFGSNQLVQPSRESVCSLADLQFDDWDCAVCVAIISKFFITVKPTIDIVAGPLVAFRSPCCCALDWSRRVAASHPHVGSFVEAISSYPRDQALEEWVDRVVRERLLNLSGKVGNKSIPNL